MRFNALLVILLGLGTGSCKSTAPAPGQNETNVSGLGSVRYTVKQPITISTDQKSALKTMAAGQDVCAAHLTNMNNLPIAGLYLCNADAGTAVQVDDKISAANALPLELAPTQLVREDGTYWELMKDSYVVGELKQVGSTWSLHKLCDRWCTVRYAATGFSLTWDDTNDPNQWTYEVEKREPVEDQAQSVLSNINGTAFCFGRIRFNRGRSFGIYPCHLPLKFSNIKLISIEGGQVQAVKNNKFYYDGLYIGYAWVYDVNRVTLRTLCQTKYGNQDVSICRFSYNAASDVLEFHRQ